MAKRPKSKSGFYAVELSRPFERRGFTYKPGPKPVQADETLLAAMEAEGVVANVAAI